MTVTCGFMYYGRGGGWRSPPKAMGPCDDDVMTSPDDRPNGDDGAEVTLSLDDGEIYLRQDGPRDAPALLLIHGNASSARWWDELVPLLTRSHRVIRVDLLGYGRSAKPPDRSYALPDQARRVGVAMDRLGVERVIAVGQSSGGATATALAEQRPGLVTALVLINTGPHLGAYIAPPMSVDSSQWPDVTDSQLRQFASPAFSRPGYQVPVELLNEVRAMTFHSLTATTQASRDYLKEEPLPDRLAPLGKPLLVIFGEEDRRWRSSSAADYHAVPGAIVEMLPGLGHAPMLEDPERTASCLLAFTGTAVRGMALPRKTIDREHGSLAIPSSSPAAWHITSPACPIPRQPHRPLPLASHAKRPLQARKRTPERAA